MYYMTCDPSESDSCCPAIFHAFYAKLLYVRHYIFIFVTYYTACTRTRPTGSAESSFYTVVNFVDNRCQSEIEHFVCAMVNVLM